MNIPLTGVAAYRDGSGFRVAIPTEAGTPYAGLLDPLFTTVDEAARWAVRRAALLHQSRLRPAAVTAAMVRATVETVHRDLPGWHGAVPLRLSRDVVRVRGRDTVAQWVTQAGGSFAGWIPGDTTPVAEFADRAVPDEWTAWLARQMCDPAGWATVIQPSACHVEFFADDLPAGIRWATTSPTGPLTVA